MITFITKIRMPEERGVASAIVSKCRSYVEIGQPVELVCPDRKQVPELANIELWNYFQIPKNTFRLTKLPCLELPALPILEKYLSHFRYSVMSWTFSLSVALYVLLKNRQLLHFYSECAELLVILRLIKPLRHIKTICEVHFEPTELYGKIMEKLAVPYASRIIVITHHLGQYVEKIGCRRYKILLLPEGVRLEDFDYHESKKHLRRNLGLPPDKIIVGYGGRFVTARMEKGIPELLRAIKILKSRRNVFLVCVGGPGKYVTRYRNMARMLNLSPDVQILDHVPPKTLYLYLRASDICVLPFPATKHFSFNMSPLKMFESMASKNPIVATDLPSIKEILTSSRNAYLVEPGNPRDLAKGIETLIANKKLSQKLASQAFADVSASYTWKQRARKILAAFPNET